MELQRISALLVEAAGLDESIAAVVQRGDSDWAVRFEAVDVEVGTDPERGRLVLLTEIGIPDEARRLAILEALMAYNFLLRETGGVRLALTAADGPVIQMVDLGLDGLSARDLATVLANLAGRTLDWRSFVTAGAADSPPDRRPDDPNMMRL